ncbi:MAG: hypothetical protein JST85_03650 [Acidobacteria bacterium]|nr:hypothetical protein [Acidobacteriota bacterium]
MINPAWIPVVAAASGAAIAFIGGLIGAGISYFNTRQQLKHQEAREKKKHHLDKLDEIFEALEELPNLFWKDAVSAHLREETIDDLEMSK